MKKFILTIVVLFPILGIAQNKSSLSPLLNHYYDIKNALVNSDGQVASEKAAAFLQTINSIDVKSLSVSEQKTFNSVKNKLITDAGHIAETKDVASQRNYLSAFSNNMLTLVKGSKLSDTPVYQMFCPMKKTYWLSNEETIKNPYYGKQMLTCGKITDTIK